MRKFLCYANRSNNSINLKKMRHRGIEDLLNYSHMFLFFYFYEIEDVFRYTCRTLALKLQSCKYIINLHAEGGQRNTGKITVMV